MQRIQENNNLYKKSQRLNKYLLMKITKMIFMNLKEYVASGISSLRSLDATKLLRVEVDIAGKKVLALVDSA